MFPAVLVVWDTKLRYKQWCKGVSFYSALKQTDSGDSFERDMKEQLDLPVDFDDEGEYGNAGDVLGDSHEMRLIASDDSSDSKDELELGKIKPISAVSHRPVVVFFKDKASTYYYYYIIIFKIINIICNII